jgi:hypothetical protein
MTPPADYTKVASYDVRTYLWARLRAAGLLVANDYIADGFDIPLVPIIPAQQVPEFNNLLTGRTYIIYDVAQSRARNTNFWVSEESITFEVVSKNAAEIQTLVNFITDEFRRYENSAMDMNLSIASTSKFSFLWFALESADPVQSYQNEGGFMTGLITIKYAYTREVDGMTGKYL